MTLDPGARAVPVPGALPNDPSYPELTLQKFASLFNGLFYSKGEGGPPDSREGGRKAGRAGHQH